MRKNHVIKAAVAAIILLLISFLQFCLLSTPVSGHYINGNTSLLPSHTVTGTGKLQCCLLSVGAYAFLGIIAANLHITYLDHSAYATHQGLFILSDFFVHVEVWFFQRCNSYSARKLQPLEHLLPGRGPPVSFYSCT